MLLSCAGCEGPILDRFLLNVLDRVWHVHCVQCSECRCPLADKCFSRDGQLFCRDDFFRRFGTKCGGCGQGILPNDLVRRARQGVYHIKCFICSVCQKQLSTGEQLYVVDDNQFLCKEDFIATKLQAGFCDIIGSDGDVITPCDKANETFSERDDFSPCAAPPPCFNNDDSSRDSTAHPFPPMITTSSRSLTGNLDRIVGNGRGPISSSSDLSPSVVVDWRSASKADDCCGSDVIIKTERPNVGDDCSFDSASSCGDDTASVRSSGPNSNGVINNNNNGEKADRGKDKSGAGSDGGIGDGQTSGGGAGGGAKRRGPRTTIKAKQLETLKSAFAATPKPTRHIREQLAQETGLNMRVIQVWFQNRRSKERRMKQLSAMGARRQFFRSPRRLRALRPGEEFGPDALDLLGSSALGYFTDGCEFYAGYPGGGNFGDYFPPVHHSVADHLAFLSPPPTTSMPHVVPPSQQQHADRLVASQLHDGMFMPTPGDIALHSAQLPSSLQPSPSLQSHHQTVTSSSIIGRPASSPVDHRQLPTSSTVTGHHHHHQHQQQQSLSSVMIDGVPHHHFAASVAQTTMSPSSIPPSLSSIAGPSQTVMSASIGGLFGHHPEMMETW